MARIDSAYFGDDVGFRNITDVLRKKIVNRKLDVVANDQLLPTFEAAPETVLEVEDEKKIREEAVKACGEANQSCMEATKSRLRQERLKEKEKTNMSSANIVKGRRLTLNIVDSNGKRRTIIVPDGQKVTLDDVDGNSLVSVNGVSLPSMEFIQGRAGDLLKVGFMAAVQVFGLAAFVMMLRDEAPAFWQKFIQGGWASVGLGVLGGLFLLAIPFGPLGMVALFYIGKGILNELKS